MAPLRDLHVHEPSNLDRQAHICVVDAHRDVVADVFFGAVGTETISREQAVDFARKAAAAPEMFHALSSLIEGALIALIEGSDEIRVALAAGKAALAKARGDGR